MSARTGEPKKSMWRVHRKCSPLLAGLFLLGCAPFLSAWSNEALDPVNFSLERTQPLWYSAHRIGDAGYSRHDRKTQLRSQDLVLNPARKDLLLDLLLGQSKQHDLIDDDTRQSLRRQGTLPPGVQKQLVRGKALPPGLFKKMVILPYDVNDYLGFKGRRDVRIAVLGDDVILYNTTTGTILDVLADIL